MKTGIIIFLVIILVIGLFAISPYNFVLGKGDSMKPTFNNCTLILIKNNINPLLVERGEIVLINISDVQTKFEFEKIAHRVVNNDKIHKKISTRGDNNLTYDFPTQVDGYFDYERILGKVRYHLDIPTNFCNGFA